MEIKRRIHKINAQSPLIPETNYLKNRIGFWGIVIDVNSLNNTVTVVSDTGIELKNIQVVSDEWVTVDEDKNYIPSTRNLPPKNSRVFVLTPTYTATGAFVLCSGFSRGDENIRTLWAANKNEVEEKNNCRETKTQGGWDITEEYANGNFQAKSDDGNITFVANTTEDSQKGQTKEVSVTAWENNIVLNENGITITDANGNAIAFSKDSTSQKNKLVVTVGSDADKSTFVMEGNKITINGHLEVTA